MARANSSSDGEVVRRSSSTQGHAFQSLSRAKRMKFARLRGYVWARETKKRKPRGEIIDRLFSVMSVRNRRCPVRLRAIERRSHSACKASTQLRQEWWNKESIDPLSGSNAKET